MTKVKLLKSMAGVSFFHSAGEVIERDKSEAARLIAAGIAEPFPKNKVERAVKKVKTRKAVVED